MWCWRRLLRSPWTARRSNQSILKEINPEYSLEGLMLKLKLQYFGHLMRGVNSLEKLLMLGKTEGRRRRGWQRRRCSESITDSMDMNLSKLWGDSEGQGSLACCSPWGYKELDTTQQLNNKNNNKRTKIKLWRAASLSGGSGKEFIALPFPAPRDHPRRLPRWLSGKEIHLPMQEIQEIGFWSLSWETSSGEGNGNALQYSCLENPMDRGAWWATVHGVTKSRTRLSH